MGKKIAIIAGGVIIAALAVGGAVVVLNATKPAPVVEKEPEPTPIEQVVEAEPEPEPIPEVATTDDKVDFEELKAINPDIYAYIKVPGTTIDFPILQNEEDNYYLNICVDGTEGYPGSIYTNKISGKEFTRYNTLIYGHNMKNGSYFGQLHLYEDDEFFKENNEVDIYLENRKVTYKIIAASSFSNDYLEDVYNFEFGIDVGNFINDVKAYAPDLESTTIDSDFIYQDQQAITLCTCIAGQADHRYLVVAVFDKVELYE